VLATRCGAFWTKHTSRDQTEKKQGAIHFAKTLLPHARLGLKLTYKDLAPERTNMAVPAGYLVKNQGACFGGHFVKLPGQRAAAAGQKPQKEKLGARKASHGECRHGGAGARHGEARHARFGARARELHA
jgi:hypothetical protein